MIVCTREVSAHNYGGDILTLWKVRWPVPLSVLITRQRWKALCHLPAWDLILPSRHRQHKRGALLPLAAVPWRQDSPPPLQGWQGPAISGLKPWDGQSRLQDHSHPPCPVPTPTSQSCTYCSPELQSSVPQLLPFSKRLHCPLNPDTHLVSLGTRLSNHHYSQTSYPFHL